MSLDVHMYSETTRTCTCQCGHEHTVQGQGRVWDRNITHNLTSMADACGLYEPLWKPESAGISIAKDLIPHIEKGLELLKSDPERFKAFNPTNGWGKYEGLVDFATEYLMKCREFPDAKISVSR